MATDLPTSENDTEATYHSYEQTLCIGQYRDDLARRVSVIANTVQPQHNELSSDDGNQRKMAGMGMKNCGTEKPSIPAWKVKLLEKWAICNKTVHRWLGEDWIFLALLGIAMALLVYTMNYFSTQLNNIHIWLLNVSGTVNVGLQYCVWTSFTLTLVLFSAVSCHLIAPQAVGSGIPEMKTVMRGVVLKEYLTFRTLISKVIGLTAAGGSGIPMGKEGPFVHISSMVSNLMSKMITSFRGIYENESRRVEMLAAACAVGVACTFGAPIGGVLFSIEVTSTYFAVRNYWRGFFAAVFSAIVFQLLNIWTKQEDTVVAFYPTSFRITYPFSPKELIFYAFVGIVCGFGGPLFVYLHRTVVLFIRENKVVKKVLSTSRFIYPSLVAILVGTLTFPPGYGQFIAGSLTSKAAINNLFTNYSWASDELNIIQQATVAEWQPNGLSFYITLSLFTLYQFFCGILTNTIPIPVGVFIPVFLVGGAIGRITGEFVAFLFPSGMKGATSSIVPGSYALVGAAAFSGSVTHTISTSVIVFELTGQIVYIVPVMLGVLIANAIAAHLQPSIYDSVIGIKKLPYLPDILPTTSGAHTLMVQDFMVNDVKYISMLTTYRELKDFLNDTTGIKAFPLVDNPVNMILLGSIPRVQLITSLNVHVGVEARKEEARRRKQSEYDDNDGDDVSTAESEHPTISTFSQPEFYSSRKRSISDASLFHRIMAKKRQKYNLSQSREEGDRPQLETDKANESHQTIPKYSQMQRSLSSQLQTFMKKLKKVRKMTRPNNEDFDLTEEETRLWEDDRLDMKLNFVDLKIDPAPFQLVEQTSLFKVHSLFSLLGLNRAYVTRLGRLVGVVAMKQLREALQKTATAATQQSSEPQPAVPALETKYSEGIVPVSLQFAMSNASVYNTMRKEMEKSSEENRISIVPEIKVDIAEDNAVTESKDDDVIWFKTSSSNEQQNSDNFLRPKRVKRFSVTKTPESVLSVDVPPDVNEHFYQLKPTVPSITKNMDQEV